ncbi:MAG: hypothetical protein K6F05_05425 [Succinivibrio sp.]|nr:hypothetical protein [Succinivibrio sp.]
MADFIVDESRFIIDDGELDEWFVPRGFELPDGLIIDEKLDEADSWQLYVSDNAACYILACKTELAAQWVERGYLKASQLYHLVLENADYELLISPCSLRLLRMTQVRFKGSLRYALSVFAALWHLRSLDTEVNLRDALYVEKLGILLPTFSLVPKITDRALYENAFREDKDPENLTVPSTSGNGGLSFFTVKKILAEHGVTPPEGALWLEQGEPLDDFMEVSKSGAYITGPLVVQKHYQIYDTNAGVYVLLMDKLWSEALLQTNLLNKISLNNISIDHQSFAVLTFDKRTALEPLNDRFFGLTEVGAVKLAQSIRRFRAQLEKADLKDALYIECLGALLPTTFSSETIDDVMVFRKILREGPFALAPLLDDVKVDCMMIATTK